MPWVIDLDGVVRLADEFVRGAADAVNRLRAAGETPVFVTNNSSAPVEAVEAKLAAAGIDGRAGVVTSAVVAAELVEPGVRVLVCGGDGVREALRARGAVAVEAGDLGASSVDAVVVGFHPEFDYERMRVAADAARRGARLIATNDDATYPTPDGPIPGAGAILASIERASGRVATVAGKPYPPMAAYLRTRFGPAGVVVGDRPDTDGRLAGVLGWPFVLVLTGVTAATDAVVPPPALVAADLGAAVAAAAREGLLRRT